MALTLNGSTNWPDRKRLALLGQTGAILACRLSTVSSSEQRMHSQRLPLRSLRISRTRQRIPMSAIASFRHGTRALSTALGLRRIQSQAELSSGLLPPPRLRSHCRHSVLPRRQDRHDGGRQLHVHELTRSAPLALNARARCRIAINCETRALPKPRKRHIYWRFD
jgi:hypothetical protein